MINDKERQIIELTDQERELMTLYIVEGLSVKQISVRLKLTVRTLEKRIETLRKRLGYDSTRKLIYELTNANVFASKQMPADPALVITKAEAAHLLKVSEKTVERLIKAGKVRATKIHKRLRISLDDIRGLSATG